MTLELRAGAARLHMLVLFWAVLCMWASPRVAQAHEFRPGHLTLVELPSSSGDSDTQAWRVDWVAPRYRAGGRTMLSGAMELRDSTCELVGARAARRLVCPAAQGLNGQLRVLGLRASLAEVVVHLSGRPSRLLSARKDQLDLASFAGADRASGEAGLGVWGAGLISGAEHVAGGWDHMAFLICLVLMVLRGGAPIRPNLGRMLLAASVFTLAHALALGTIALGLRVPAAPLEVAIALSIVVVAADLVRTAPDLASAPSDRATRWSLWGAALGFGYIHGLGFGSALMGDSGDAVWTQLSTLVSFNVGVELAQLAFVCITVAAVALARRVQWRAPARLLVPYGVGTVAAAWCFERFGDMF